MDTTTAEERRSMIDNVSLDEAQTAIGILIDAAEAHASCYDDDPRECIKTDVMNAFYAGVAWQGNQGAQAVPHADKLAGSYSTIYNYLLDKAKSAGFGSVSQAIAAAAAAQEGAPKE
jgi:hypothetical protein